MLHKTDKGPIYGVRGVIHFFKEKPRFLPKEKRTHEKTYVFSHAPRGVESVEDTFLCPKKEKNGIV